MFDTEHNSIRDEEDMTMARTLEVNKDSEESYPHTHLDDILEIMVTVDRRAGNTVNLIPIMYNVPNLIIIIIIFDYVTFIKE